jgi:hypothetical protein
MYVEVLKHRLVQVRRIICADAVCRAEYGADRLRKQPSEAKET